MAVEIANQRISVPCPADQLLHVCVHGAMFDRRSGPRWIADALSVVRFGVDWGRLVEQAIARRLTVVASATLGLLTREFDASVPAHVLDALAARPAGLIECAAHGWALGPASLSGRFLLDLDRYARARRLALVSDERLGMHLLGYVRHSHDATRLVPFVMATAGEAQTRMLAMLRREPRPR